MNVIYSAGKLFIVKINITSSVADDILADDNFPSIERLKTKIVQILTPIYTDLYT